jgi:hypothetical protein
MGENPNLSFGLECSFCIQRQGTWAFFTLILTERILIKPSNAAPFTSTSIDDHSSSSIIVITRFRFTGLLKRGVACANMSASSPPESEFHSNGFLLTLCFQRPAAGQQSAVQYLDLVLLRLRLLARRHKSADFREWVNC